MSVHSRLAVSRICYILELSTFHLYHISPSRLHPQSGNTSTSGYTGRLCELQVDECQSQPCYFNGTCTDLVNGFNCTCLDGFMGQRCEAIIRQCPLKHPCGSNAVCVEHAKGLTCTLQLLTSSQQRNFVL